MSPEHIAAVCHEANRAYCEALGDFSQLPWAQAPEWARESARLGVAAHVVNPGLGPDASHKLWFEHKFKEGWKYGPVKDEKRKEHPCMVPFEHLPPAQQAKDRLFAAIVKALA